jgi:hypothetical protein
MLKVQRLARLAAAAGVLLLAGLACDATSFGFGGATAAPPPGPPHFYLASDKAGSHAAEGFSPGETVYLLIDARGLPPGVVLDAKWYGLNLVAVDPRTPLAYQTVSHDGISPTVEVWFGSTTTLPAGQYRVDVFENGNKIGERFFTVR